MSDKKINELEFEKLTPKVKKSFIRYLTQNEYPYKKYIIEFVEFLNVKPSSSRGEVFKKMFGSVPFNNQKIYELTSWTNNLLDRFLLEKYLAENPLERAQFTIKSYNNYVSGNLSSNKLSSLKQKSKKGVKDADYFRIQNFILQEEDKLSLQRETRKQDNLLQQKSDYLNLYFFSEKLKDACEMMNRQNIVNVAYTPMFVDEVVGYIEANPAKFEKHLHVWVYYLIYNMLRTKEQVFFDDVVERATKINVTKHFKKEELKDVFNYLQNFCVYNINQGVSSFLQKLFDIYSFQIEHDLFLDEKQHITQWDYKNIVTIGLRLQNTEWTYNFLHGFKKHLREEFKENAFNYNLANFYYETNNLKQAKQHLLQVTFSDVYYNLSARSILLKIYYEEEETEALFALVEATINFLKRNKLVSAYQKRAYKNLFSFTKRVHLTRISSFTRKDKKFMDKMQKLKEKIEIEQEIANKSWVLSCLLKYT